MSTAGTSFLISQLGYRAPSLIVYLGAAVLACVFMSRATLPSVLALIGAGILGTTAIGTAVLQAFLIGAQSSEMPKLGVSALPRVFRGSTTRDGSSSLIVAVNAAP